jgi:hypothetical protein
MQLWSGIDFAGNALGVRVNFAGEERMYLKKSIPIPINPPPA